MIIHFYNNMKQDIPNNLINSKYRKEMWNNSKKIIKQIEKILPISSAYLLGSFASKKRGLLMLILLFYLKLKIT